MILYLLRHGIAEDAAPGSKDADRELTDVGREKLEQVLRRIRKAGVAPDLILTSPFIRALQTAKIAAKILDIPEPVEVHALEPSGNPRGVWNELRAHSEAQEVLLSGHEPLMSSLASYLLDSPSLRVDMKKGAVIAIEFETLRGEPRGVLRWMLTAKLSS